MKSIDSIIKETVNRYINENVFGENDDKSIKTYNQKTDAQKKYEKSKRRDGNSVSSGDEDQIRHDVDGSGIVNVAALAREVYPNHTPEGAQSQLRKKLKGLTNDNGSEYHIKEREANIIQKVMDKI